LGARRSLIITGPDENLAVFINCQLLAFDEFFLENVELFIVQIEFELEAAIGNAPLALKQCTDLVYDFRKSHSKVSPHEIRTGNGKKDNSVQAAPSPNRIYRRKRRYKAVRKIVASVARARLAGARNRSVHGST
jgi:hypothetical protein